MSRDSSDAEKYLKSMEKILSYIHKEVRDQSKELARIRRQLQVQSMEDTWIVKKAPHDINVDEVQERTLEVEYDA